jgi:hypothetical protein
VNELAELIQGAPGWVWGFPIGLVIVRFLWLALHRGPRKPTDTEPAPPPAPETLAPARTCLVTGGKATHARPVAVNPRPWWSTSGDSEEHPPELCERYAKAYAIELEHFLGAQRAALEAFGSQQRRDLLAFENGGCVQLLKDARKGGS